MKRKIARATSWCFEFVWIENGGISGRRRGIGSGRRRMEGKEAFWSRCLFVGGLSDKRVDEKRRSFLSGSRQAYYNLHLNV